MASGTINFTQSASSGKYIDGKIEWSSVVDEDNGYSDITAKLYVRKGDTTQTLTIPTDGKWKYTLSLGDEAYSGSIRASVLESWVLIATASRIDMSHKDDGTLSIALSGSITAPTGTSFEGHKTSGSGTATMDTIPRASTIYSAGNVTLGNACNIKFVPASASFRYRIKFAMGGWEFISAAFHPGKTSLYTYDKYVIPLEVAKQMPYSLYGTMSVTLATYSDSDANVQIGSSSSSFVVTVPDNAETKPSVTMTLSPISSLPSAFAGLFVQGKTKVKATLTASGKYGATIMSYSMTAEGKSYGSDDDFTSDFLSNYGAKTIHGYAVDARGFVGSTSKDISVIAYSGPRLLAVSGEKNVIAARCDKDGSLKDNGTYLKIKARRSYYPVVSDGVQKNFCKIEYRYKQEGGSYNSWATILASNTLGSDEIITGALLGGVLEATKNYVVQVRAIDDIGEADTTTISVPTDKVYSHENGAINSYGFGTYVQEANTFLMGDDITLKSRGKMTAKSFTLIERDITVGGDPNTYYPVHINPQTWFNSQPIFLSVGKMLGTASPAWEGNHSSGTSSLMIGWTFRCDGWDGNGSYFNTLYKSEPYAKLIAHVEGQAGAARGVVVWLRGGGADYKMVCSAPSDIKVYLEDTDISNSAGSELIVSPREYEGNLGILYKGCGTADVVIEEGTSGIWSYRKWSSGVSECWGVYTAASLNCGKINSGGFYHSDTVTVNFPTGLFASTPIVVCDGGSYSYMNFVRDFGSSATQVLFRAMGLISTTTDVYVRIHAKGKWK